MATNKPNVQRYDDMGCPEQICCVDTMPELDDGDYVLYEDYEALREECEKLRGDVSALVEALTELCDEIDKHDIHAAISKTSISWFKRKARKALAAAQPATGDTE